MSVEAFCVATAHLFGDALPGQHRLRHRIFVDRQHYDVPVHDGMEFDQFDTPAAWYVVRRDEHNVVRAINRLIPTTRPYMLPALWPDLVQACDLPANARIWEGSRIGVDGSLDARLRDRYFSELLCGVLEFGLHMGIDWYIGVMPTAIAKRSMAGAGLDVEWLGEPRVIGQSWNVVPLRINVTEASLAEVRRRKNIDGPVLARSGLPGDEHRQAMAA